MGCQLWVAVTSSDCRSASNDNSIEKWMSVVGFLLWVVSYGFFICCLLFVVFYFLLGSCQLWVVTSSGRIISSGLSRSGIFDCQLSVISFWVVGYRIKFPETYSAKIILSCCFPNYSANSAIEDSPMESL